MSATITERNVRIEQEIHIIGLAAQTTNEKEMNKEGVIPTQWEKWFRDQWVEKVPNQTGADLFALYTNYVTDETGPYTFAIGKEVREVVRVPEEMTSFTIPAGDYVVFTTRKGPVQEVVVEAWQHIWQWSQTNARAFATDFELYNECSADLANAQVDIYISVK